jgi:predicted nuclease of predicted toxin-antitoxin system
MQVLCDVHMPYRLVNQLRERGVDATHVNRILDGSETKDSAVAAFADANGMVLISKDSDFRDSHFVNGTPARLLRVTLGNPLNTDLLAWFEGHWDRLVWALAGWRRGARTRRSGKSTRGGCGC